MSLASILLRVLLSLSLVLNGVGYAMASTSVSSMEMQMQMRHAKAASQVEPAAVGHAPAMQSADCHPSAAVAASTPVADPATHHQSEHQQPAPHQHTSIDCCQSDKCSAPCMQLVHAVVAGMGFQAGAPLHFHANVFKQSTHASPVFPHLIRPPIA